MFANFPYLISADLARQALPNGHLATASAHVPLLYHENDTLEAFLDRTLLRLYEQLLAKSGSHSQAARLLRIDRTSLYQRLERARRRSQGNASENSEVWRGHGERAE